MQLTTHYKTQTASRKILTSILIIAGVYLLGSSAYMQAKAVLAQWLIASSWKQALNQESPPPKPWWWADTRAIALLEIPTLNSKLYVMQDASGESLAFGPGHMPPSQTPAHDGHVVIAGHRDSHFSILKNIQIGDTIKTTHYDGQQQKTYHVSSIRIINSDTEKINITDEQDKLTLITCYPFDGFIPGGPLRLIVESETKKSHSFN